MVYKTAHEYTNKMDCIFKKGYVNSNDDVQ